MAKKKPEPIVNQSWYTDPELRAKKYGIRKDSDHPQGEDKPRLVKCPRCEQEHWAITSATRLYCRACKDSQKFNEDAYMPEYPIAQ